MMLAVSEAIYLENFKITLVFNNGKQGLLDFQPLIEQEYRLIFQDLRNLTYFQHFILRSGTLCWPNELDFAPEFLFFQLFKDDLSYHKQFIAWGYQIEN